MKTGIKLIVDERKRQIEVEGWDAEHDAEHDEGELSDAAICYAAKRQILMASFRVGGEIQSLEDPWPDHWDDEHDKREKHSRIRRLVIAGALIAAEIDRLRMADSGKGE